MHLFFVLSGFLITGALLDSKKSPNYYTSFFGRRVLRIFPLYYLMLIAVLVIWPLVGTQEERLRETAQYQAPLWLFLQNWTMPLGYDVKGLSHFWSLAVEEQFYLVWPFVVMRLSTRGLVKVCAALVVIALAVRSVFWGIGASPEWSYSFTICRMDALAMGAALAALLRMPGSVEYFERNRRAVLGVAFIVPVACALITHDYYREGLVTQIVGYPLLGAAFAALILIAVLDSGERNGWLIRAMNMKWLRACGKYSFAMYVFHFPLNRYVFAPMVEHAGHVRMMLYAIAMIPVSFVVGFLSWHLIEKHFLKLKKYFRTEAEKPTPQANTLAGV